MDTANQSTKQATNDKFKGYICSCCGLFVKSYRRNFNSNMALALLILYNSGEKGYVHMEELMKKRGYKRCGDFSYLVHYLFIERLKEKRSDGSSRNGMYKLTGLGMLFCESKITAKEKFIMFNNSCDGFEGKDITIREALGKKFNYDELMGNVPNTIPVKAHTRRIAKDNDTLSTVTGQKYLF